MREAIKKELLSRSVFSNEEKIKDLPQYMNFAVPVDTSLDYILHAVNQETRTEKGGGEPGRCKHAEEILLRMFHNNIEKNNGNGAPNSDKRLPGFSKEGSRSGVIIFRAKGFKQPLMDLWKKYKNLPFPGEVINECIAKIGIYKGEPCAQCGAQINVHALENYLKDSRVYTIGDNETASFYSTRDPRMVERLNPRNGMLFRQGAFVEHSSEPPSEPSSGTFDKKGGIWAE